MSAVLKHLMKRLCWSLFPGILFAQTLPTKPNIIVMLWDDAGFADFSFQGSQEFQTPRIDELVSKGVNFTQGYVSGAVCHPSRAGLLTGRKQERFGHHFNGGLELQPEQITIAEHLKPAGYRSMIIGKWHLGKNNGAHPIDQGFDEFFGLIGGSGPYFDVSMERGKGSFEALDTVGEGEYLTDRFGNEAVEFIERNQNNPFFLYFSLTAVHSPNHAKAAHTALFDGTSLSNARKTVASMTYSADSVCGMIMDKLAELNLEENTLVFFLNDNGGADGRVNAPLSGMKGTKLEGGIRIPYAMVWKNVLPQGVTYDYPVSTLDVFATSSAIANIPMPGDRKMDGINLIPFVLGQRKERPHKYFYFDRHFSAMRYMDYKLILLEDTLGVPRNPILYDISKDISEENDLASVKPGLTTALKNELERWISEETTPPLNGEGNYWKNNSLQKYEDRGLGGTFVEVDSGIVLEPETLPTVKVGPVSYFKEQPIRVEYKGGKVFFYLPMSLDTEHHFNIMNIQGKNIKTLSSGKSEGAYVWDGRNSQGRLQVEGLYVLQIKRQTETSKTHLFYLKKG